MKDNPEVQQLIQRLFESLAETVSTLRRLDEADLDRSSGHPCAMGGSVRKLLIHNVTHDRVHLGQIYEKRWALDQMQEGDLPRLLVDLIEARGALIAALVDLPDEALDQHAERSATETTLREVIEHVIYWEQDSMAQTRETFATAEPKV
jgi:uncharacterized damage-inducible protein DinB